MTRLIKEAIQHKGFSLVNVFSPCVTYNKINSYDWFKAHCLDLDAVEGYDSNNRIQAISKVNETQGLLTGLIYKNEEQLAYEDLIVGYKAEPIVKQDIQLEREQFEQYMREFN